MDVPLHPRPELFTKITNFLICRYESRRPVRLAAVPAGPAVARPAPSHTPLSAGPHLPAVPVAAQPRPLRAADAHHPSLGAHHLATALGTDCVSQPERGIGRMGFGFEF